jgi:hypothetical protein
MLQEGAFVLDALILDNLLLFADRIGFDLARPLPGVRYRVSIGRQPRLPSGN